MPTTEQMIGGALRLIGALAAGETIEAEDAADSLRAFNEMAESWSVERLAVYTTQNQSFSWPVSQASRTIGPTGNFVGTRPSMLDSSTYFVDPTTGLSYQVELITEAQYNAIALKTATSTFPQVVWFDPLMPNAVLTVYPVPTRVLTWNIVALAPLAQSASLATDIAFPPGYARAFRFNLACELAAEYGVEPSAQVRRLAIASKRNLKRVNNPMDLMGMPPDLLRGHSRFNIYSGG